MCLVKLFTVYAGPSAGAEVARLRKWHDWCLLAHLEVRVSAFPRKAAVAHAVHTRDLRGSISCFVNNTWCVFNMCLLCLYVYAVDKLLWLTRYRARGAIDSGRCRRGKDSAVSGGAASF